MSTITNSNSSINVPICIEPPDECQVQEITYEGQEKYITPLSMSENLTKLAQRIDFSKTTCDEELMRDSQEKAESDTKELATFQPSLWPWDSVRNKLKNALTEATVLYDVLSICKDKRVMVLDPVAQEPFEIKPISALIAKKKALAAAAAVIMSGSERLKAAQSVNRSKTADFHEELLVMRQNWRLRKKENMILGDLSFRSAGSRFYHTGTFEVAKNEIPSAPTSVPTTPTGAFPQPERLSALKVTVPSDLDGGSFFQVKTQKDNEEIVSGELSIPLRPGTLTSVESSWQQKLETAQNVLFNKELFAHLAREAVPHQPPIPTTVIGNQIVASLFPGIQLSIGLCHATIDEKQKSQSNQPPAAKQDLAKPVLEHSLHQLLREHHYNTLHHPMPHPTTATLGVNRRRYLAGSEAYDRYTISEAGRYEKETILEQIIWQTQHDLLRLRTMCVIDNLAADIKDPLIVAHWLCLNSTTKTSVKINIVSYGYDMLCRTPLVIHVGTKTLKAICRDGGRVINMSYESQELRYLLLNQASLHQVHAVQQLAKMMAWRVLSMSSNIGVGPIEPCGTAASLILASPNGDRLISIRCGPQSGIQVSISSSPQDQDFYPSTLVKGRKWQNVNGSFREVAWEKIEGKNFISKMEYLMAAFTTT